METPCIAQNALALGKSGTERKDRYTENGILCVLLMKYTTDRKGVLTMPNTREKLIELFRESLRYSGDYCGEIGNCQKCKYDKDGDNCGYAVRADYFIANDVTVQKWIPVSERLPEDGAVVLGYMVSKDYRTIKWKNNTQRWEGLLLDYAKEFVTHWMPLPEPPKGE